jgi:LacI family transcriptional regulator, galactose operon repressor
MTRPRVRLRDVAAAANTSAKTASRVINGDPRVAEETRARVEQAVRDLGYQPDPLARSLRKGTDDTIGVVIDSVADPFFASVTGEIERLALKRGITVIIASTNRAPDRERSVLEGLAQRRVAGLIVAPVSADHTYVRTLPCPVVFVDRRARNVTADAVVVDDREAAATAVRHLITHGHRRIAFIGDGPDLDTARLRLAGYRDALAEAGIDEETVLECRPDDTVGHAAAHTTRLLADPGPPTAIFSGNTRCSLGIVPVLHRRNRLDVALVAFGDFPMADSVTPAVTVIDHPSDVIGRLAAEQLMRRLEGDTSDPVTVVAPVHLVSRGSGEVRP